MEQHTNLADREARLEAEWVAVNAFRGLTKIATNGDLSKSTYDNAIDLGGALYPQLLGPENSLLRRERESETTKEYRQRAEWMSVESGTSVNPLDLVISELTNLKNLLTIAEKNKEKKTNVDQLKRRVKQFDIAKSELSETRHSENSLIFRDAYNVNRHLNSIADGQAYRDFSLPDGKILRLRVLHPDKPEHVTGADIIYERHDAKNKRASIVAVQYKIWEDRELYLNDERMQSQLTKMKRFLCDQGYCQADELDNKYRFPHCSAFFRPTDRLQNTNQKFISVGEHLPICHIDSCTSRGEKDALKLEYKNIRKVSLSSDIFEYLFNKAKIGSRKISYKSLQELYEKYSVLDSSDTVIIYAQEF